jgi:hypothetical protein
MDEAQFRRDSVMLRDQLLRQRRSLNGRWNPAIPTVAFSATGSLITDSRFIAFGTVMFVGDAMRAAAWPPRFAL